MKTETKNFLSDILDVLEATEEEVGELSVHLVALRVTLATINGSDFEKHYQKTLEGKAVQLVKERNNAAREAIRKIARELRAR